MVTVFEWLRNKTRAVEPLTGGQVRPRVKTYSAESGYAYQYVFVGQRRSGEAIEYVFDCSWDRSNWHRIPVLVTDNAIAFWTASNGRDLTPSERYAVAKIALRNAFDRREPPASALVAPCSAEVVQILDELRV